jgi:hypothetical protein
LAILQSRNIFLRDRKIPERPIDVIEVKPAAKLMVLTGIVIDVQGSRACIEDPATAVVSRYAEGDFVAGGNIVRIRDNQILYVHDGAATWVAAGHDLSGAPGRPSSW